MTDNKSPEGAPDVYVGSIPSLPMRQIKDNITLLTQLLTPPWELVTSTLASCSSCPVSSFLIKTFKHWCHLVFASLVHATKYNTDTDLVMCYVFYTCVFSMPCNLEALRLQLCNHNINHTAERSLTTRRVLFLHIPRFSPTWGPRGPTCAPGWVAAPPPGRTSGSGGGSSWARATAWPSWARTQGARGTAAQTRTGHTAAPGTGERGWARDEAN